MARGWVRWRRRAWPDLATSEKRRWCRCGTTRPTWPGGPPSPPVDRSQDGAGLRRRPPEDALGHKRRLGRHPPLEHLGSDGVDAAVGPDGGRAGRVIGELGTGCEDGELGQMA